MAIWNRTVKEKPVVDVQVKNVTEDDLSCSPQVSSEDYGMENYKMESKVTADTESEETGDFIFTEKDIADILPGNDYDDDLPASTLRMWLLAFGFGAVVAGVDSFFTMRFPSVSISVVVILVVTWPLGQLLHYITPEWTIRLPYNMKIELNPGPFNYKEHGCIFMFTNVVTSAGLVNNLVIEDFKFFNINTGIGRQILFNMSCYILSFSVLGLARRILVVPQDRVWPGMLSRIALFKAIYSRDNPIANGWKISRWVYLVVVFFCSFVWYWFPDLILPFLSIIGAWISWIRPNNATLSQVFGVKTGLGIFPLTFDWSQISTINNPLTTPLWAVASMFGSFVFWIWIVMPGLYYQNHWSTAHMPIMSNSVFTLAGKKYDFQKVVDSNWKLDMEKYKKYSPPFLPIAFLMSLALSIGVFASLVVHFSLVLYEDVIKPWKTNDDSDHLNSSMKQYKPFPLYTYVITLCISLGLGFAFTEGWSDAPIDAGGYIVSIIIGIVLFLPISLVEARANANISIQSFFYIVSANWYKGQPVKLLYFYSFGFGVIQHGMHMAQGAKVGHYLRIRPKIYMFVLFMSGLWAAVVSPAVSGYILNHFKDICTADAENNMTCRRQATQFNIQGIWGLFGNHLFAPGGRYSWVLWFFLVGAVVALAQFVLKKWKPTAKYAKRFDPVLFFAGAQEIPGVTGYNVSTWFAAAFVFNYLIHKKFRLWWRKYNLVTSIGLDCGVAIAIIVIYFAVVYTGGSAHYKWWATEVGTNGCDAKGCPHITGAIPKPSNEF